ncbi:SACE_7040 family transcriptional regulator [Prauserella rugosa]|uniref:TetR family transcriptional regulator n=1 Tax=Prauserella rugosa TaxID=43354 RepID=A0A660CHT0_9PSEU|nr:TetR/AcrR family transcriptional regulator [Prauserella rugosa]KID28674.1 transcriptional regulator, TetR family [Prauserella sp. Am3]KMS78363.1 TetR family transcriptional regulator [Streptomyces regensis]TWH20475.1 TetR family transcriptional regulator [Prauserella rugosa]
MISTTPRTRGQKPSRRDQILAAAAELFAQHGFRGVGIDDIGAAVGITGPALYRHFRSKDAMLGEMLTDISEYLLAGGTERIERDGDPDEILAGLVRFHVDFALQQPALITVQERSLASLADDDRRTVRGLQRRYVEVWVSALRAAVPHLDEPTARSAAHAVFGLMNSTPHHRHLPDDRLAELLTGLALGALYAAK